MEQPAEQLPATAATRRRSCRTGPSCSRRLHHQPPGSCSSSSGSGAPRRIRQCSPRRWPPPPASAASCCAPSASSCPCVLALQRRRLPRCSPARRLPRPAACPLPSRRQVSAWPPLSPGSLLDRRAHMLALGLMIWPPVVDPYSV
ncbi:hypothetical protein GQ55_9G012300 [Panicum hallii var. hallii]|uniref:Uncharacterized protein n=1 Tax=Panicum hallii var. hallii TaxID=1504633 RepID=A0A2T7BYE6_9POAL|nr:hypothetical protein GQ55_9G012300 [Panicum hallii var. hallii]